MQTIETCGACRPETDDFDKTSWEIRADQAETWCATCYGPNPSDAQAPNRTKENQ